MFHQFHDVYIPEINDFSVPSRITTKHYLKRTASAQLHTALKTDNSPDGDSSERLTNFFKVSILIVVSAENINSYPIASKKT